MTQALKLVERDRDNTEDRLIDAVGAVIARDGFGAVGVNAIAREAGVDKVLIYRYFGGLPELLEAYGEKGDFWWQVDDMIPDDDDPLDTDLAAWLTSVFRRHVAFLRHHTVTLEILAWEMAERNPLTAALEVVRETRSLELMRRLANRFNADEAAVFKHMGPIMALLGAASGYLVTRARSGSDMRTFNGIDVQTDRGWAQIHATVELMIRSVVELLEAEGAS